MRFLIVMAATSLVFNLFLKNFGRGIIPYDLCFVLLSVGCVAGKRTDTGLLAAGTAVAIAVMAFQAFNIHMQNLKTRTIFREYDRSESGTIYLKDNLFLFNRTETAQRRNTYTNRLRQKNPSKPFLVIYPEVMKDMDCLKDTNAVIKVGDQSWVCIRSASCPRDFVVEKTILPSAISRKMQPRVLDFSSGSDIFLDSTSNYSSVLYVNVRPYIKADVIIE